MENKIIGMESSNSYFSKCMIRGFDLILNMGRLEPQNLQLISLGDNVLHESISLIIVGIEGVRMK